ncbi:hypothetical protein GCM10010266_49650 [Streptomyces griseomycini]|nr:hypothetical protein GCM10010266_49650 [Streptomyces griseomycini]GGR43205.1 hypothetical protein GCM10015536_56450 [Streptomyces griseomycini]
MADARPGARIVHIARLALVRDAGTSAPAFTPVSDPAPVSAFDLLFDRRTVTGGAFKHSGEVILASIAFGPPRARLVASCSLVSLAVQSLRSM